MIDNQNNHKYKAFVSWIHVWRSKLDEWLSHQLTAKHPANVLLSKCLLIFIDSTNYNQFLCVFSLETMPPRHSYWSYTFNKNCASHLWNELCRQIRHRTTGPAQWHVQSILLCFENCSGSWVYGFVDRSTRHYLHCYCLGWINCCSLCTLFSLQMLAV